MFAFSHDTRYVSEVLALARVYGQGTAGAAAVGKAGLIAVAWALAQVGTPYVGGGETPGAGFGCSGLVQAAYRAAGSACPGWPRTSTTPGRTSAGSRAGARRPGVLRSIHLLVSHVGIYAGAQGGQVMMVGAPHTGAAVRVEAFPATPGAPWGSDIYLGATRPSR